MVRTLVVAAAAVALLGVGFEKGQVDLGQPAQAKIGGWFKKTFKKIGQGVKKAFTKVKKGFQNFGKALKKGFQKAGKAFKKAAEAVKKGFQKVGNWFKDAGKWLKKNIGNVACQAVGPLCTLPRFFAKFKENVKKAKAFVKSRVERIKDRFFAVLNLEDFKKFPKACLADFSGAIVKELGAVLSKFNEIVGMPFPLDKLAAYGTSAALGGLAATGFCPMAAIHIGVKKLITWAVPKLILGVGGAYNAASANKHAKNFGKFLEFVLKIVSGAGSGLGVLGELVGGKLKAFKNRVQGVLRKVADVSGRIQKGLEASLKLANAVSSGEFATIEAALKDSPMIKTELGPEDIARVIDGLKEVALEQIWNVLRKPLRKLVDKGLSLLGRLLDIPRNALVGAVGTIPFAGGVLAAALNFLLGVGVDFIFNFLADQIDKLVEGILKDQVLEPIAAALKRELTRSGKNVKAAQGVVKLVKTMAELAGKVNRSLQQASAGMKGTFRALASTAVEKILLRGVAHAGLRKLLSDAAASLVDSIASRKVSFGEAILRVLKTVARDIPGLVAGAIRNPAVRTVVQSALAEILQTLTTSGLRGLVTRATGLFRALATQVFERAKDALRRAISGVVSDVNGTMTLIGQAVKDEGISALLGIDRFLPAKGAP